VVDLRVVVEISGINVEIAFLLELVDNASTVDGNGVDELVEAGPNDVMALDEVKDVAELMAVAALVRRDDVVVSAVEVDISD